MGVKGADRAKVDRFGTELVPLVTSGPPGVTGFAGGRPKATEIIGFWPALMRKELESEPRSASSPPDAHARKYESTLNASPPPAPATRARAPTSACMAGRSETGLRLPQGTT